MRKRKIASEASCRIGVGDVGHNGTKKQKQKRKRKKKRRREPLTDEQRGKMLHAQLNAEFRRMFS